MGEWERNGAGFIAIVVPLVGIVFKHEYAWWIWLWLVLGVIACAVLLPDREKPDDGANRDPGS